MLTDPTGDYRDLRPAPMTAHRLGQEPLPNMEDRPHERHRRPLSQGHVGHQVRGNACLAGDLLVVEPSDLEHPLDPFERRSM